MPSISLISAVATAVGAKRSVAIHDGLLNDNGHTIVGRVLGGLLDTDEHHYERLQPGTDLSL